MHNVIESFDHRIVHYLVVNGTAHKKEMLHAFGILLIQPATIGYLEKMF